ncbi:hypothetical protein H4217_007891 [Coemansia sp. RSA 1939]|nr:hypothetical protein H4217_007891 [Coemansia sp. RSA 1939]
MDNRQNQGTIPTLVGTGFLVTALVVYITSAVVSLLIFLYGLILVWLQPSIWKNRIARIIIIVQLLNCMRFVIRIIASFVVIKTEFGCRAILFVNNVLALLPVNLCIYCVLHLQLVIIHKVSPQKRWPTIVLISLAIGIAIIPASAFLYTPPSRLDITSYCNIPKLVQRKYYIFLVLTISVWQYFSGIVGAISVTIIGIHIVKTRKSSRRILALSLYAYHPSYNVIAQSKSKMLHRALLTIIWYPVTPIVSLWLNTIIYTVSYYRRTTFNGLEYVNVVFLGLQSVLLGIALIVNPTIRDAYKRQIKSRLKNHKGKNKERLVSSSRPLWQDSSNTLHGLPPHVNIESASSLDMLSDTLSAFSE